jgi:DNA-directed RNA polymerase subunit M/transcription elongation factor TFIIS
MLKHIKNENETHTYCEDCGYEMPFKATIIMNNVKRNCPKCGREYFVETPEIDWSKIVKNNN